MSNLAQAAGIDCGKDFLDISAFPPDGQVRVANTPDGHRGALRWLVEREVRVVGLEASGGYERGIRDALLDKGLGVRVFDPARVRCFARATGRRAKNDRLPFDHDSGRRRGQRHIAAGRAEVRRALYLAAMSAALRAKGVIADFYTNLIQRGKPCKVAMTACMRKLLVRLNAMLAKGASWQPKAA